MAVKVVYDSTRGLVQENDSTGAGGFEIKDAFISQGSESVNAAAAGADALLSPKGVSIITSAAGNDHVRLQDGTSVGQQKIIVHEAGGQNLSVENSAGTDLIAAADTFNTGDVALLMWNGSAWLVVASS